MVDLVNRSTGKVLRVHDEAQAEFWLGRGFRRDEPKAPAKKSASTRKKKADESADDE